jgi:alpha-maltose-1-phosphate synthase
MKVLLAHPGTQSSFNLAIELERQAALLAFHTGFAFCAHGLTDRAWRFLPANWRRRVANRRIEGLPRNQLHCHPLDELKALMRLRNGANPQAVMHRRNERFQRNIPDDAIDSAQAVIGFDTSSWILSDRCMRHEVPFILSQTTLHPDTKLRVCEQVKRRFPDWENGSNYRLQEVRVAEDVEHAGAQLILTASSFTRQTLIENGVPEKKIRINPYGVDCDRFSAGNGNKARKFRFAFVGAISARKGIPLLLEAWQKLGTKNAELWLVGSASQDAPECLPELSGVRYIDAVPQAELSSVLQQCDVFVFPSYFEGFGKVILEAMACGLPVLTTTATVGNDIITQGQDGWIIDPGDLERLTEIMSDCLSSREEVHEMGRCARATAERHTWAAYGQRLYEILAGVAR